MESEAISRKILVGMEKIFHISQLNNSEETLNEEKVRLKNMHLLLEAEVAENAFGGERQVYTVFYPNLGMLLMAPMSDQMFKQAHECSLIMIKDRNLKGDKSMSLHEIIIDHELDSADRPLTFTTAPGLRMLQVQLAPPQPKTP